MISALMPNFSRADVAFDHGQGPWLFDTNGRRYLDFGAGIATSSLGHGHPHLVKAIAEQAAKVIHVSNLYRVPQAETLAARFVAASFADSVFFCNSGAEANEGLIKAIRKTQADAGHPERTRIICFEGAFHGRTLATVSATGNPKYLAGFGKPVEGFDHVPFNNLNAVRAAITAETAGILIEPIQGEGGIRPADEQFLHDLRATCDEFGLILGFDEVQTGMGRTGKLLAHQWIDVEPDVASLAKGIGGGFPMAALLAKEHVAKSLVPGSHGTTFGGSPLACAAGNAVLDVILADGFLDQMNEVAAYLHTALDKLIARHPAVFTELRGKGLLLGLKCAMPNGNVQTEAMKQGLLTVAAGENVLRLIPPLIINRDDCNAAITLLDQTASALAKTTETAK
ncbi:aspartate aminotransferase family protein [Acidocella aminolytica]|jgi:acetylornithine/N-succinyldiaminopimelate aminotransferase|uniref:Acetylornithine aminotransferase n=1 Tax=Acidocella aminolytica 101 = DSM 11237 TaxID=1120923 RepID=A0A0D6PEX4_9PROT|nr:aspartate aminotransferase family protein [Acidocella aminolytica]GAN79916.1 aminotransferase, acetylornithine aminotransferase [Acidocella aminolytica 101 = DSM 11237]GBQ36903.1 acetylornithine/succinylornithine aminotransferase [Acidocella aminolytica 101 = DSM 11237]SHE59462.1 acetylornithine/N-succinyldiaminopimelate aminotransferase [Acidocella aminolytica 101 = DSM 11237]